MNFQSISGNRNEFSFSERLFNGFCFVTAAVFFIYIFIGLNVGGFRNGLVNIIATSCFTTLYILSRFWKKTKIASSIFAFLLLTILSVQFFQTQGLQGVIPLAFVMVYLEILFVVESKNHTFFIIVVFLLVGCLAYLNFNYPEYFGAYPNETAQKTGIMIMTFMTLAVCTVLATIFIKSYEIEKKTVEDQYQELTRIELEVKNQNATLEALNNELTSIAYRTSHDLVAPLKTVKGYNELLLELMEDNDVETAKIIVNNIRGNLLNMEELILNMASIVQSEENTATKTVIDFEDIIQRIAENYYPLSAEKKITIQTDLQYKSTFYSIKSYIQQILEQLIVNGIKFSDPQKENRYVRIETQEKNGNLYLLVKDNGLGIPEGTEEKIFDMFYRGHSIKSHGSGLGLYLTKKLITKLNGNIDVSSSSEGTTFTIVLKSIDS